jgi:type IV pilus assembly protein PilC
MSVAVQHGMEKLDEGTTWQARATVPRRVLVGFSRHLSAMLNGGIPLVRCLECLSRQDDALNFGVVVEDVARRVSTGAQLSDSLRFFPRTFSPLYIGMIKVGEMSGQLTKGLDRLGEWLERDDRICQRVKAALTYPTLVLLASLVLTVGLFYFVVPQFLGIFVSMGKPLPLITRAVLFVSSLAQNPGFWR